MSNVKILLNVYLEVQIILEDLDLLDFLGFLEVQEVLDFLGNRQHAPVAQVDLSIRYEQRTGYLLLNIKLDKMEKSTENIITRWSLWPAQPCHSC